MRERCWAYGSASFFSFFFPRCNFVILGKFPIDVLLFGNWILDSLLLQWHGRAQGSRSPSNYLNTSSLPPFPADTIISRCTTAWMNLRKTAILSLKENFKGQIGEDHIRIGICNKTGVRRLIPSKLTDYWSAKAQ